MVQMIESVFRFIDTLAGEKLREGKSFDGKLPQSAAITNYNNNVLGKLKIRNSIWQKQFSASVNRNRKISQMEQQIFIVTNLNK